MLKKILSSTFVIYDTEYTAWKGSQENDWKRYGEYREIIEIGAVRASLCKNKIVVKEEFTVLVRPVKNPLLSGYIKKLCRISQRMIEERGVLFQHAWKRFLNFTKGANIVLSFGEDNIVIRENLKLNNVFYKINKSYWFDYKKIFIKESKLARQIPIQSCDIPKALGIKSLRKQRHRALSDVFAQIQGLNKIFEKIDK